jgi:hypothetical protein
MQAPMPLFDQPMLGTNKVVAMSDDFQPPPPPPPPPPPTSNMQSNQPQVVHTSEATTFPSSPEPHKSNLICPTTSTASAAAAAERGGGTSAGVAMPGVVSVAAGKQIGDRLFLQTSKLKLLLDCLEALNEAATMPSQHSNSREPRPIAIAFTPQGVYVTVSVPSEGRCHSLCLPEFFFVRYRTISPGFRAIVDFREFIFYLNLIYSTHHGRCLEILDQPDNTLLVHALLDENKFFDATLKTHAPSKGVINEPILQAAYYRYPFLIKVSTNWLHNIFKRLQQKQRTEVIVEFNGETGALEFLSTMEGAPFREGVIIPPHHILQNPFLPTPAVAVAPAPVPASAVATVATVSAVAAVSAVAVSAVSVDTHVVYTDTRAVTEVPKDRVPESVCLSASGSATLTAFRYRSQFAPRSIWLAVKRNKVGSFIHMYIAPKEPILFQYILQRSHTDSRRAASYDTWIKAVEKVANPNIRMPAGGSAAVARKMLEIAPNLGSNEQTLRVGAQAIQQITGYSPNTIDKLKLQDLCRRPNPNRPSSTHDKKTNPKAAATTSTTNSTTTTMIKSPTNVTTPTMGAKAIAMENGFVDKPAAPKRKLKSRSPPQLDADGNPIVKKRGRPPKNPSTTATTTTTTTIINATTPSTTVHSTKKTEPAITKSIK